MDQSRLVKLNELSTKGATYQDIADELGVSRQRAHSLLRSVPELKQLRDKQARVNFLEEKIAFQKERSALRDRRYGGLTAKEFHSNALLDEQNHRLQLKKRNSKAAGVAFDLEWGDLEWPTTCPVLGILIDYFCPGGKRNENSASFDRIDSTLGYVKGNVRVVSWRANRIKNDGTAEEHRLIAEYLDSVG